MPKMQELPLLSELEGNEMIYVVKPDGNGGYTDHMTTLDRIPSEGEEVDLSEYVKTEELDEKLEDYVAKDSVGAANGVASLGDDGKVPAEQLPDQEGSSELNPVDLDFAIETTNQGSTITIFDSTLSNLEPTTGDYTTGTLEHVGTEQQATSDITGIFTFKTSKNSKFRFKLADNRTYQILALGYEIGPDSFGEMPEMDPDQGPVGLVTTYDGLQIDYGNQSEYKAYPENFDGWLELEWTPNKTLIWRMLGEDLLETPNPDKNTCFNILVPLADNGGYDTSFEFAWDLSLSFEGQAKSVNTNLVEDNVIYIANESVKALNRYLSGGDLVTFYDNKTKLMVHHQADRFVTFDIGDDTNKFTAPSNLGFAEYVTVNDIDKIGTVDYPGVHRTTNDPTILGVSNLVGLTFDEVDGFGFEQEWDEENPPSFLEGSADLTLDTSDYFASIRANSFTSYICIGTGTLIWDQDHNLSSEDFTGVAIAEYSIHFFLDGAVTDYIYGPRFYKWNKVTNQIICLDGQEEIPYNVPENSTAKLMMEYSGNITQSQYYKLSIGTVDKLNLSYFSVNASSGEMSLDFSEITDDLVFYIFAYDKDATSRIDLVAPLIAIIIRVRPNGNSDIIIPGTGTGTPTPFDYNVPLTLRLQPNILMLLQNDTPLVGGNFERNLQSIFIADATLASNNQLTTTYNDFVVSYDFSETAGMSKYTLDNYADGTLIEVTNSVKILDRLVAKGTFIIPTEDKTNFVTLGSGATGSLGENGRYLGVIYTNDGQMQSGLGGITPKVNDYLIATGVNYDNPALMYYDGSNWNQASNLPVDVYQSTIGNNTTGSDLRNSRMAPDTSLSDAFWTLDARTTLQPSSKFIDPYTDAFIYAHNGGAIRLSLSAGYNLSIFVQGRFSLDCRFSIIEGIGAGQFVRTTNPDEQLLLNHQLLFGPNDNSDLTIRFFIDAVVSMEMHHFVICFNPAGQDAVVAIVNQTSTYQQT